MEKQAACFFRFQRGQPVASSAHMGAMTNAFLRQVDAFVEQHQVPLVSFPKGQHKDELAAEYCACFQGSEGVVFLGKQPQGGDAGKAISVQRQMECLRQMEDSLATSSVRVASSGRTRGDARLLSDRCSALSAIALIGGAIRTQRGPSSSMFGRPIA
jgi:hypothetical protein